MGFWSNGKVVKLLEFQNNGPLDRRQGTYWRMSFFVAQQLGAEELNKQFIKQLLV